MVVNLKPTEEYRTTVLSGLPPSMIMECAGRAMNFWVYQTIQDRHYQEHLFKSLSEQHKGLKTRLQQAEHNAQVEAEDLKRKLHGKIVMLLLDLVNADQYWVELSLEQTSLFRKNQELAKSYAEKKRNFDQLQQVYNSFKKKTELGNIKRAAALAVDAGIQSMTTQMEEAPNGPATTVPDVTEPDFLHFKYQSEANLGLGRQTPASKLPIGPWQRSHSVLGRKLNRHAVNQVPNRL